MKEITWRKLTCNKIPRAVKQNFWRMSQIILGTCNATLYWSQFTCN